MPQPQPLPPFTKDDLRKALGVIWHKAPVELKNDIDVLCDEIQERGVTGDGPSAPPGFVPSPAGSMIPPPLSPPPSAHAATDWKADGGDEDGDGDTGEGEVEGGWARYL
jgi:hypothetical protein